MGESYFRGTVKAHKGVEECQKPCSLPEAVRKYEEKPFLWLGEVQEPAKLTISHCAWAARRQMVYMPEKRDEMGALPRQRHG